MKSRPKSFPASSTFNEFLTQLKEEDQAAITAENPISENSPPAVNPSITNPVEKFDEPNSEFTQISSVDLGTSPKTGDDTQVVKLGTEILNTTEAQKHLAASSTDQITEPLVKPDSGKSANTDQQKLIRSVSPTLAELTKLLDNLPTAQITRQRFSRDEMQIRLSADLSLALRNFSPYVSLINPNSTFHIDDLVNHLVRQFVLTNLESIQQMGKQLAKAETSRQLQIYESLRSIENK